ncbi:MAG: hypothetical protein O2783_05390 [Chloroflexi bacterium]|nr:hypothetical protein [Chloroflexota bacterium]
MNGLLPFILPLGAVIGVATVMLSLGAIFLAAGKEGTIIIGLAIIVLVPLVGALLSRGSKETPV